VHRNLGASTAIIHSIKKPVLIAIGASAFVLVAALAGAYIYFFSNLRNAPAALTLPTTVPTISPASSGTAAPTTTSALTGTWTVTQGSEVGYRVTEQFAGQTSPHQAVARTSSVTGSVTALEDSSGTRLTTLTFTAQLAGLASQDTVAGFDVSNRDRIVSQALDISQYPTATFVGQSVALDATLESGQTVSLTISGQLTIHGHTQTVQVAVQVKLASGQIQAAGSTTFDMTQFGITKPTQPFVTPQSVVTLEFLLLLTRSA
jgi:polyisoprenoid-binding protein YceI